jgi:hypothetical protein
MAFTRHRMEAGLSHGFFLVCFVRLVVSLPGLPRHNVPGGNRRDGPLRVLRVFVGNLALAWQEPLVSAAGSADTARLTTI